MCTGRGEGLQPALCGKTGAGGESRHNRLTCRARLRSRTTASSRMCHVASSCTSCTHVYLATRGCRWSLVGLRQAPDPPANLRAGTITRNAYTHDKGELAWDTLLNRLILRLSLQSGNETNDPLKSGPAKAGPAGPATPPLYRQTELSQQTCKYIQKTCKCHRPE